MKNYFVITLAVFMGMALVCTTAAAATMPISEDFSIDEGVLTLPPTYSVGGGTLNHAETTHSVERTADVQVTDAFGKDIVMSMTVSVSEFAPNSDIEFMAFAPQGTAQGGYLAGFKPDGAMRILDWTDGIVSLAEGDFGTFSVSETYEMTLTVMPNGANLDLTLTVDPIGPVGGDATTITGTTSRTISSNQYFGIRTRMGFTTAPPTTASFDDFSVTEVPEPSVLVALAGLLAMLFVRRLTRR